MSDNVTTKVLVNNGMDYIYTKFPNPLNYETWYYNEEAINNG